MGDFARLRPSVRLYVAGIVLVGFIALAQSIHRLYVEPIGEQWFILAGLTLLTGSFTVKVPSINAHISVSETFVFASVLLFGPAAGAITVLLECLIINFWIKHGRPLHRVLFNITAPAVAIWISGHIFYFIARIPPFSQQSTALPGLFPPLLVFTTLYFILNSGLVAVALGLETGHSPLRIWSTNFIWLSVNYFSGASVAALIVTYTNRFDVSTLAIILPLLLVSYLTFRTAMGRVEDSNKHLAELNKLYLSTIETLANAIDAKDQITHGHIRRVQSHAVQLAVHLGVTDERLIKAVEAAALLHDMGKLAIPEYILNKPGTLTESEFDIMKLHASAGADILSAIEFPYPVVPIVRHHHEHWDGSGYPDCLKGTDIPIGARILSVVDCYDALTSDRPYRPRLSDDEALEILKSRKGSMYDPLVVDAFLAIHPSLRSSQHHLVASDRAMADRFGTPRVSAGVDRFGSISRSTDETVAVFDLARDLGGVHTITTAADVVVTHLKKFIPFSVAVLFVFDDTRNELVAQHSSGDHDAVTSQLRIRLGHHLSGWVAANRRSVLNSDATLDFGDVARHFSPPLRSALSSPIVSKTRLLGVLTLYSNQVAGFSDNHRRILDLFCEHTAIVCNREATPGDLLSSIVVDSSVELERFLLELAVEKRPSSQRTLLLVDCGRLHHFIQSHGSDRCLALTRSVATTIKAELREPHVLVWFRPYQFVGVLENVTLSGGSVIADAIANHISDMLRAQLKESFVVSTSLLQISEFSPVAAVNELLIKVEQGRRATHPGLSTRVH